MENRPLYPLALYLANERREREYREAELARLVARTPRRPLRQAAQRDEHARLTAHRSPATAGRLDVVHPSAAGDVCMLALGPGTFTGEGSIAVSLVHRALHA